MQHEFTPYMNPDWLPITSRCSLLAVTSPLNPLLYLCQFGALPLKRLVVVSPDRRRKTCFTDTLLELWEHGQTLPRKNHLHVT